MLKLMVETVGGQNLGRCYSSTTYKVSCIQPLHTVEIEGLRRIGMLGYGQEWKILNKPCMVGAYTGAPLNIPGYEPEIETKMVDNYEQKYYVYYVSDYVDSSD